jgi:cytoskeletal protein CcmA (bactofilin family)
MLFKSRSTSNGECPPPANTIIGNGSSFRGTLMVSGTLRIEGEFEGDILNCDRLEVGEHGIMRSDVEVKEALIQGRVIGNVRALGVLEMKNGAKVEGDVAAYTVGIEPGVLFSGRCTMLETGPEGVEIGLGQGRAREHSRG